MAGRRAKRRPKPRPALPPGLTIRVDGPIACGKSTALTAIRHLLQDAGAKVQCFVDPRWPADGEVNVLVAETNPSVLRELRDWIAQEPT